MFTRTKKLIVASLTGVVFAASIAAIPTPADAGGYASGVSRGGGGGGGMATGIAIGLGVAVLKHALSNQKASSRKAKTSKRKTRRKVSYKKPKRKVSYKKPKPKKIYKKKKNPTPPEITTPAPKVATKEQGTCYPTVCLRCKPKEISKSSESSNARGLRLAMEYSPDLRYAGAFIADFCCYVIQGGVDGIVYIFGGKPVGYEFGTAMRQMYEGGKKTESGEGLGPTYSAGPKCCSCDDCRAIRTRPGTRMKQKRIAAAGETVPSPTKTEPSKSASKTSPSESARNGTYPPGSEWRRTIPKTKFIRTYSSCSELHEEMRQKREAAEFQRKRRRDLNKNQGLNE